MIVTSRRHLGCTCRPLWFQMVRMFASTLVTADAGFHAGALLDLLSRREEAHRLWEAAAGVVCVRPLAGR